MIGLLGGTFDPVHHGHLRLAINAYERVGLDRVLLIPLARPNHRHAPVASATLRQQMLEVAVRGNGKLAVDDRELRRPGVSYTLDTLESLREEFPTQPLCWLIGMDSFANLDQWHEWERLPELAHFVIAGRADAAGPSSPAVAKLLAQRRVTEPEQLAGQLSGLVYFLDMPLLDISASRIRTLIGQGEDPSYLIPEAVLEIIKKNELYV